MKLWKRLRVWLTPGKMCRHCCIWCEYAEVCVMDEPFKWKFANRIGELKFRIKYKLGIAKEGIDFIVPGMEDEYENGE